MESQPQNPEFRINPENFHTCICDNVSTKSCELTHILKPNSNRSPNIIALVQKVKHRVYKIHAFLNEAILCRDSVIIYYHQTSLFLIEN